MACKLEDTGNDISPHEIQTCQGKKENIQFERFWVYICHICKASFKRPESLKVHLTAHSSTGEEMRNPHRRSFSKLTRIAKERIVPRLERPFSCTICEEKCKDDLALKFHLSVSHRFPYKCCICDKEYRNKLSLKCHLRTHWRKPKPQFPCPMIRCNKKFSSQSLVESHVKFHSQRQKFPCEICNKEYSSKETRKQHMLIHTRVREITRHHCEICNETFNRKKDLRNHMLLHSAGKEDINHQCKICGKIFSNKKRHAAHVEMHKNTWISTD
ncbi:gastrula zinc finger protein XlCGF7.1-like isoform X2 [Mercenaria mercenaria]|uniref:gastrula zinc finger protein XlCGF7.1-like isoform X2 n=1 Tax=Mercenaria mercenaria TaxID=6596 RepID=UPI00234F5324|nr:gastrula zinc finger protein XlCGF7.1-like isoform X2 [Mercenaria mercenaria]